ncbi:class I SAM-dependent methyltransferase [Nanoarchaeota archaeon]
MSVKRHLREEKLHKKIVKDYELRETEKVSLKYNLKWYEEITKLALKYLNKKGAIKIMDIGCGTALSFLAVKNITNKFNYIGYDLSQEMLNLGKKRFGKNKNFKVKKINLDDDFKLEKDYDLYIIRSLIHHLDQKERFLDRLLKQIDKTAVIVISEPNKNIISHFLREVNKKINKSHFEEEHEDLSVTFFKKYWKRNKICLKEVKYFGYLAYPFGFPDMFKLRIPVFFFNLLWYLDQGLSQIPLLNRLSWHAIQVIKKC